MATSARQVRAREVGAKQAPKKSVTRWSQAVTERSNALDLEAGVFKLRSARQIAESLKRSADRSRRRKASPFQSAMSMLNFYLNRGGRNLAPSRQATLNAAKDRLRVLYGRPATNKRATTRR